jgi:DnaJ-class molecular chaperone
MSKSKSQLKREEIQDENDNLDPVTPEVEAEVLEEAAAVEEPVKKGKKEKVAEVSDGCENCSNTGLEPGVSRDTAQVCPVCKGSPFAPREEVK